MGEQLEQKRAPGVDFYMGKKGKKCDSRNNVKIIVEIVFLFTINATQS